MDLDSITDIKELKALAFDSIVILETAQANIQAINKRIAQIKDSENKTDTEES